MLELAKQMELKNNTLTKTACSLGNKDKLNSLWVVLLGQLNPLLDVVEDFDISTFHSML